MGPVMAVREVLGQAGMTLGDIDLIEINEAFAAQVLACVDELGIDMDKLNTHGGSIALGHPFGMTGARIMGTLINGLRIRRGLHRPGDDVCRRRPGNGDDRGALELARN